MTTHFLPSLTLRRHWLAGHDINNVASDLCDCTCGQTFKMHGFRMDYQRFSLSQFERSGRDTDAARRLADELQDAVQEELHATVHKKFQEIVDNLNHEGHNLQIDVERPGELTYFDLTVDDPKLVCKLRLAVDSTISAGFAHIEYDSDWSEYQSTPDKSS